MTVNADVEFPAQPPRAKRRRPLLPGDDPFYVAPKGFAAAPAGAILRSREIELALLGLVPQKISAWQLLYRTCDLNGVPEAAVTTVLLPSDADPSEPRPIVAYQCAIDAISARCFPSYSFQRGSRAFGSVPALELLVIASALRRGWAVSVADHEGVHGYFGAPREPGYRALDGVRAALAFEPLGLDPLTKVGLWGYSGGGMATSWAAEMATEYAPELDIVGASLGSSVGDPGETFIRLNGTFHSGLPAIVVAALRHLYPGLERVMQEHVDEAGRRRLDLCEKLPTVAAILKFAGDDFDNYTDLPIADVLAMPEVLEVFDDIRLGMRTPAVPLLMVQSVNDQIINVEDVDGQARRYSDGGAHVTYVRDRWSEHITLMILAAPTVLDWLSDRFDGKPLPKAHTRTVRSIALKPSSLSGFAALAAAAGRVIAGRPVRSARPPRFADGALARRLSTWMREAS
ncbi:lipase family protein [Antrihabitans sp. YC2-6]|uniref:lipase family protein n=1 Tax=Antrihabitans sp. YC2-6 TaxID=2799498 RepID=UPI0018F6AEDC|nr:lipase family protein [Antrihabitans sp. YC2-6]MBJ8347979.1 lipase [Antrihabitans sp. YC2-6]